MLIVRIHNDGSGDEVTANYDAEVLVTTSPTQLKLIAKARIERHRRGDGWRELLQRVVDETREVDDY